MGAILVQVNLDLFRVLIGLPPEVSLTRVRQTWEQERVGAMEFLVEGPGLPEVPEGAAIPIGYIEVTRDPGCKVKSVVKELG